VKKNDNIMRMLWQLVKFRFKVDFMFMRSVIAVLVASYLFPALMVYLLSILHFPFALYLFNILGIVLLTMYFILNSVFPNPRIQKSDIDFLLTLPLEEKELRNAFLLYAFLVNLLITLFPAIFLFPAISYLFLLIVLMTAAMYSFAFFAFKRKIVVVIIVAWMLSSLLKFPFSPFSMVFGYVYGYYILASLTVITVFLGMRNARVEDLILEYYKRLGLLPPSSTTSASLYSYSPFITMLKKNLNFLEYGARANLGGYTYFRTIRVKVYEIMIVTALIGIIVYASASLSQNPHLSYFIETYGAWCAGSSALAFITNSAFVDEPLWLYLSAMTPLEFARKYLLAKTLSVYVIFLPISISLLLLNPMTGIGSLFVPLVSIYNASINARFSATTQYYNLFARQLSLLSLIPTFLDFNFPVVGAVVTLAFTLPFLFSRGYWEKTFEKAITSV